MSLPFLCPKLFVQLSIKISDLRLLMESHSSLLLQLISRQTNAVIQGLLMRHTLATSAPKKKKADLAKMLLMHVLEDPDPETRYRKVLADFTKRAINEVLPVRAARKADAVEVMMRVDRLTFSRPADRDPSIAMMQLVPVEPLSEALVQEVGAQQKKMKKTWVRLARRKLKSQQMITALKKLISGPDADRMSVNDLRLEVGKMIGVAFDTTVKPNMYVFFHKHLQRLLRKKVDQRNRPRRKRRSQQLAFVNDADAVKAWGETQAMWAEDNWPWKFAMLDEQRRRS